MKPASKFLHSIFEVSHVEFQTYDFNKHKLLFSSGIALKILGYTEDEYFKLSNDFYKELVYPDDWQKVEKTCDKLIHSQKGEIVEMTVRMRRRDGKYVWSYSRLMVLKRNANGNIRTIIREAEDITSVIELQDQLREKVEKLKTISYKNSHLLRSPVASIIGLVNMVEEQGITTEHNLQIFKYLKEAIEKLDVVIHEINDVARL